MITLPYLSIDIETTGLDPEKHQILEIGIVWDNGVTPDVDQLPRYQCVVDPGPTIIGSPFALQLNKELLYILATRDPDGPRILKSEDVVDDVVWWLRQNGWDGKDHFNAAGKNFASFDWQFLRRLPGFTEKIPIRHRVIDPAILFLAPNDIRLPDTSLCYKRAKMNDIVAHNALVDAIKVVELIRKGFKNLRGF